MEPSKNAARITKYQPPLAGRRDFNGLRLDFSERTIAPGPNVQQALKDLSKIDPTIYPEYDGVAELRIARYVGVEPENIVVTNGSDLALCTILKTFVNDGEKVLTAVPTFPMFYQYALLAGAELVKVDYDHKTLEFPESEFAQKLQAGVKVAIFCNPNNPTGSWLPIEQIEKFVAEYPETVFLIDEAYAEFSGESTVPLINKYSNIIVTRTLSKAFGIAGARIGYSVSSPETADLMRTVMSPYEVNIFGYELAKATLLDIDDMKSYVSEIVERAKPRLEAFFKEQNVVFYPSRANFLLFETAEPEKFVASMKKNGILLRPQQHLGFGNLVRISFGTLGQIEEFIAVYKKLAK